jgi:hypothetical protein
LAIAEGQFFNVQRMATASWYCVKDEQYSSAPASATTDHGCSTWPQQRWRCHQHQKPQARHQALKNTSRTEHDPDLLTLLFVFFLSFVQHF